MPPVTRSKSILTRILPFTDLVLVLFCAHCAPTVTNLIAPLMGWTVSTGFNVFTASPFMVGAAIAAAPIILRIVGFYHRNNMQRVSSALRQLLAFLVYCLGFFGLYQITRPNEGSLYMNHVILVSLLLIVPGLFLRYYLLRLLQISTPIGRRHLRQVIIAGEESLVEREWATLPEFWKNSLNIVGRVVPGRTTQEEVQALIEQNHVQQLMLFGGMDAYHSLCETINRCELQGIDIYVHLRNTHSVKMRADINEIGEHRVLILTSTPVFSWACMIKSIFDRVVAALGIILSSPFWVIAAIGIKISDPNGKVFYRQQRSGLYGRPFSMWKFRSMYSDADQRLDEIKAQYGNEMDGPIFKLTNDPRIFPFGHFLRKTSIDELPQLINVLMGDMSLVGPRPLPTYETAEFPDIAQRRRLSVKPGLTCYWQVEDRSNNKDFGNMVDKDLKYIDNWSLWVDIVLILRTIPAVLFGRGAK